MTDEETIAFLIEKDAKKKDDLSKAFEQIKEIFKKEGAEGNKTIAPLINESDLQLLSQTKVKLGQKDILKMYV